MLIAHTADVHIRSLSRHDEYRFILKSFVDDCKSQKVDHIFVGGDIFHTKTTGISPEYIELLTWWLNEMSLVASVHLILGNHDLNLSNLSRQDAVSPIVSAMKNPKVHLYKRSGIYPIEKGFNFCVFSCIDEEKWPLIVPVPGDVNIAAFHGPVRGSVTETGWNIEEGTSVSFFENYDFVMLGDIHKPQILGYRDGKPWIAYPGSTIQQNYSEQLEHSYLLWNIKNSSEWNVISRSLPNPKPYLTIGWSGNIEKTIEDAKKYPKGSRFRIRSNVQIAQDDIHVLSETLKATLLASEVTYKSDFQIDRQTVSAGATSFVKNDLRSPEVMMMLLKNYHKDLNLSEDDLVKLSDLIKKHLSNVSSVEDSSRGYKWNLRSLKWDNLFSYGEGNHIDFEKLNGIVGIFGPNRTGKSSIVGTIMYALFNTTDRGPMKNINICNVRKDYCFSQAIVDHNGESYVIERQTAKSSNRKGIITASTKLNLFRMRDSGEMDDLCGEQRNDTEKSLRALFGSAEDFLMTSLSAQGETNQFLSLGSSKRRSILTKFLDLDIFDKMNDIASKEVAGLKSQLKNYPDRDWKDLEERWTKSIQICKDKISELELTISENQTALSFLHQELKKHNVALVTQHDVDVQKKKVEDLQKKSHDCTSKINLFQSEIEKFSEKLTALKRLVDSNDLNFLKSKLVSQNKLERSIDDLNHALDKEKMLHAQQKKSLKILDEVPCGDEFPTCKFIRDAHNTKKIFRSQEKKVQDVTQSLFEAKTSFDSIKDDSIQDKINKIEKANDLISKLELEISKKETEIERLRSGCVSTDSSLADSKNKLRILEEALDSKENEEAVTIKKKIFEISESIKFLDSKKMDIATQCGKLISQLEKLQEEKSIRDSLLADTRIHDLIVSAFSKKGIPLLVTRAQLPIINSEVSKILQGIVDFTIDLENDEDTDTLEIYINYGDSRRIIEMCSGMEKTIASIALRVAMLNISSLPKPNFFIIDEGFGTLDSSGIESCNRLLSSIKRHFKSVLVITHVDGIKDSADYVLEITKSEKDSKLEYS